MHQWENLGNEISMVDDAKSDHDSHMRRSPERIDPPDLKSLSCFYYRFRIIE